MIPYILYCFGWQSRAISEKSSFGPLILCSSVLLPLLNNAAGEAIVSVEMTVCDCGVSVLWSSLFHGKR